MQLDECVREIENRSAENNTGYIVTREMERWTKSLQLQRLILDRGKSKRKTIAKTDYLTDIFILPRESKQICQPKTILVIGKMQEGKKRKKRIS